MSKSYYLCPYGPGADRCAFSFMSEIEEHGGVFVRRNLLQEGYMYVFTFICVTWANLFRCDVPEDTLDEKELKTREIIEFSERHPQQYLED